MRELTPSTLPCHWARGGIADQPREGHPFRGSLSVSLMRLIWIAWTTSGRAMLKGLAVSDSELGDGA